MAIFGIFWGVNIKKTTAGWWFQPIWKIYWSNWKSSPSRGEHKKYLKPPPRTLNTFSSSHTFTAHFSSSHLLFGGFSDGNGTDFLTDFASTPHAIGEAKWCNSRKQSKIQKKKWGKFCFRCLWSWILFIFIFVLCLGVHFPKILKWLKCPFNYYVVLPGIWDWDWKCCQTLMKFLDCLGSFLPEIFLDFRVENNPKNGPNAYCTLFFWQAFLATVQTCRLWKIKSKREPWAFLKICRQICVTNKNEKSTCFCIRTSRNLDTSNRIKSHPNHIKSYEINSHHWFDPRT